MVTVVRRFMFVLCKKDVIDNENRDIVTYTAGKRYEAKIITDEIYLPEIIQVNLD